MITGVTNIIIIFYLDLNLPIFKVSCMEQSIKIKTVDLKIILASFFIK